MLTIHLITSRKRSSTVLTCVSDHFPPYVQFLALPGGQSGLIWLKFLNLVKISEIWSKFSEVLILFCLKIFYLKIFHLKILHWIRRQCVDCRYRNVDSDSRPFKKSTVTVACRLSTFLWPQQRVKKLYFWQNLFELKYLIITRNRKNLWIYQFLQKWMKVWREKGTTSALVWPGHAALTRNTTTPYMASSALYSRFAKSSSEDLAHCTMCSLYSHIPL